MLHHYWWHLRLMINWHLTLSDLLSLRCNKPLLSLSIQQSVALYQRQVACLAVIFALVIMVEASLAGPLDFFDNVVDLAVFKCLNFLLELVFFLSHCLWLSTSIILVTGFLASEAKLSTLEVVIVTSATFPSAWWENELLFQIFSYLFDWFFSLDNRNFCLVKRSHSTC